MGHEIKSVGGARIGWVNASWPLATLTASQDELALNASLIGKYTFSPEQVISIETYTVIPFFGWGIKINHNVANYPRHMVFWCFGPPTSLIAEIEKTGFVPGASPDSLPANRGIAVRWLAIIGAIALWNLLFLTEHSLAKQDEAEPGVFVFLALGLLFCGAIGLIFRVRWLQFLIMKPGRSPEEIKQWLYLLAFISGLMCFFITIFFLLKQVG